MANQPIVSVKADARPRVAHVVVSHGTKHVNAVVDAVQQQNRTTSGLRNSQSASYTAQTCPREFRAGKVNER